MKEKEVKEMNTAIYTKRNGRTMAGKIFSGLFWAALVFIALGIVFCVFAAIIILVNRLRH